MTVTTMNNGHINFKNHTIYYPRSITWKRFQEIKESYNKELYVDDLRWWYTKSPFLVYFLEQVASSRYINYAEVKEKEWKCLIQILKHYFLTYMEFQRIIMNTKFMLGELKYSVPDKYFETFMLLNQYGNLSYNELQDMDYKTAIALYYYGLGFIYTNNKSNKFQSAGSRGMTI